MEHLELGARRRPAALGGQHREAQRAGPIRRRKDTRGVNHGEPGGGLGAAHPHGIAQQADPLAPEAWSSIADDDSLREPRRRFDVAALSSVCELVDGVVVAAFGVEAFCFFDLAHVRFQETPAAGAIAEWSFIVESPEAA